jgi:hypothetical protein
MESKCNKNDMEISMVTTKARQHKNNKIFDPAGVARLLHDLNNNIRFRWNRIS